MALDVAFEDSSRGDGTRKGKLGATFLEMPSGATDMQPVVIHTTAAVLTTMEGALLGTFKREGAVDQLGSGEGVELDGALKGLNGGGTEVPLISMTEAPEACRVPGFPRPRAQGPSEEEEPGTAALLTVLTLLSSLA